MSRSLRTLSGLLALLAITFSFAESVIASTCAPVSTADAAVMAEPSDDGAMDCPFGPAMGQSCTAAPSLPALVTVASAVPGEASPPVSIHTVQPDLLMARAPFHPPRA